MSEEQSQTLKNSEEESETSDTTSSSSAKPPQVANPTTKKKTSKPKASTSKSTDPPPPNPKPKTAKVVPKPPNPSPPPPSSPPPHSVSVKMSSYIGVLRPFDHNNDDFEMWWGMYEMYLVANDLDTSKMESKCVGILLSSVGIETYSLLVTLVSPEKPASLSIDGLKNALVQHFKPAPKAIAERFRFMGRKQGKGELVHTFLAALRKLAIHCKFEKELEARIRDQFIFGLQSEAAQKRLFTKDHTITLQDVISIATAQEQADASTALVRGTVPPPSESVHKVDSKHPQKNHRRKGKTDYQKGKGNPPPPVSTSSQGKNSPTSASTGNQTNAKCKSCGSSQHPRNKCYFREAKCNTCGKIGHIAKVCKAKSSGTDNHHLSLDSLSEMNNIRSSSKRLITIDVKINGVAHTMELDTGCETSVISNDFYINHLHSTPPLCESKHIFRTYTKETFRPVGDLTCIIEHNGQSRELKVPVSTGSSLFGKDFLHIFKINWKMVETQCHKISVHNTPDLQSLLKKYESIFQPPTATDRIKGFKARIILKDDATPRFLKARTIPYALRDKVDKELDLMEATGVISKVETSEWASPLVVVPKADGRVRITGDFKMTVNNQLCVTQYPLALPDDIFANLGGCNTFSKIDGNNAYHQMELDESSKIFLVINTHRGLYRYNVLPQGIASSPAIFQSFMDTLLQGIKNTGSYIDDTVSGSVDDQTHLQQLDTILKKFQQHNYKLSPKKCQFMQPELEFLGHHVSKSGIQTTAHKVQAITQMPQPRNVTEVKSFLGLVTFYGKFVPNLSTTCEPLYRLTRKDEPFLWGNSCQRAFEQVKNMMCSTPTLAHFDPAKPIGISCDASPLGLGAVLFLKERNGFERPIAYYSKLLSATERNYSQIEKEGLAIVLGIKKYYKYLCGRSFTLVTDHKPLLTIFGPKSQLPSLVATRLHHWSLFLSQFQYEVIYRKSDEHGNADALSRLPIAQQQSQHASYHESCVKFVANQQIDTLPVSAAKIRQATVKDPLLSKVLQLVLYGWPSKLEDKDAALQPFFIRRLELTINQGILMWGIRVIIPSSLQPQILLQLHEAHLGVVRMKALARQHVFWPGIDKKIEETAKICTTCQQSAANPPSAPLHPWQFPEKPWQRLHMDLAGPYLKNNFLVITDAHSKWPEVFIMNTNTTTTAVLLRLVEVISRFGVPEQIVTDNGPQFVSSDFEKFCKQNGIKHILSSPYHPRTNGEAERFVRTFKEAIKTTDISIPLRLHRFLLAYRTTPHATTGVSPAELLQNRKIRTLLDLLHPSVSTTARDSQSKQEKAYNSKVKSRAFNLHDPVWVKTHLKGEEKWTMGKVIGIIGPLTYNVQIGDRVIKRHTDQMREALIPAASQPTSNDDDTAAEQLTPSS